MPRNERLRRLALGEMSQREATLRRIGAAELAVCDCTRHGLCLGRKWRRLPTFYCEPLTTNHQNTPAQCDEVRLPDDLQCSGPAGWSSLDSAPDEKVSSDEVCTRRRHME